MSNLFCLPFAGGSGAVFHPWRAIAPDTLRVTPLALPGRGAQWGEPLVGAWAPLLDCLYAQIESSAREPYALFGHSMGALIAFELAHRLRECGLPAPALLIVSASRPPRIAHRLSDTDWRTCSDRHVLDTLFGIGGADPAWENRELRELMLPVVRNDFQLCADYRYRERPPLATPIHVLAGRDDSGCPFAPAYAAWRDESSGATTGREIDGGHLFLRDDPAAAFAAVMDALGSSPGAPLHSILSGATHVDRRPGSTR
ncbi:alpha/beta fold hydrolase [Paraburkholderia xenovorans]|uniref:thioesterase II family protein n=1 Tax=Paraburkholderia xenovorans TaxID=36873 RepID=UPI0038B75413